MSGGVLEGDGAQSSTLLGHRVLLPGGGGRLARALIAPLEAAGAVVWAPSRTALDLTSPDLMSAVASFGPTRVILAAAITSVDRCEREPAAAQAVNVDGAARLMAAARCPGIYVSTDYVFGAVGEAPFDEAHPTGPLQVYGHSKLAAETRALAHGWGVARVAWLWGDGQGFPRWVAERARADGQLSVAAQRGTPTLIGEVAVALVGMIAEPGGVRHLVGDEAVSRKAWAEGVLRALAIDAPVSERPMGEVFDGAAPRPHDSSLAVTRADTPRLSGVFEALGRLPPDLIA